MNKQEQHNKIKDKDFGMKEYSGEGPALDKSHIVDGGNYEDSSLVNEESPVLSENFNDSSDDA